MPNINLDYDRIANKFYRKYKRLHKSLVSNISGITNKQDRNTYSSLLLNRIMILYFLQKNNFLDSNKDYLLDNFNLIKCKDKSYYKDFLRPLFFEVLNKNQENNNRDNFGKIPYLNGGIFNKNHIEKDYECIKITNDIFEKIINTFDDYHWVLKENDINKEKQVSPKILGYIFEKYINQKEKGAYYTKKDITDYITERTIAINILYKLKSSHPDVFKQDGYLISLLRQNPYKYIYDSYKKGINYKLPNELNENPYNCIWDQPAYEEYSLTSLETWKEVFIRRKNYNLIIDNLTNNNIDIEKLISLNINIRKFIIDIIKNSKPKILKTIYNIIDGDSKNSNSIKVLDPACGSGAFLFSALDLLSEFKIECLNRMRDFAEENKFDFNDILSNIEKHDNEKYYVYKSIMIQNLYGVDIMEEAVIIAKMRLFLNLISLTEDDNTIESFPDIDFNIIDGNSLVGCTDLESINKTEMNKIINFKESKKEKYRTKKEKLNKKLNKKLWQDNYKDNDFNNWVSSAKPFNWAIEFFDIIKNGGFDCIIGNPPYVEYYTIKNDYKIKNYETEKCNNLSAFIAERSFNLLNQNGNIGFINPISIVSTPRMSYLRDLIQNNSKYVFYSNFADRPGTLFQGVHQKLSIFLAKKRSTNKNEDCNLYTTNYKHWYSSNTKNEREFLFDQIRYIDIDKNLRYDDFVLKFGKELDKSIWSKIQNQKESIYDLISKNISTSNSVYLSMRMTFWSKCFSTSKESNEFKEFNLESKLDSKVIVALLNSSLFFYFWELVSDCWHITNKELKLFKINISDMDDVIKEKLANLSNELEKDLEMNKREVNTSQTQFEYLHKKSKIIIDEIDNTLAKQYNFTDKELDYIKSYNIKYRMSDELNNYLTKFNNYSKLELSI